MREKLYAPIRPKCVAKGDASLLDGLEQQGIEYVEIRSLDIDPYCATGISLEQIYFMDVFLTYCLLTDSPSFDKQQQNQGIDNMKKVASAGRSAGLETRQWRSFRIDVGVGRRNICCNGRRRSFA